MKGTHSKKQAELKPKHKRGLRKFAKLLHGLGVNVSEHIEKLELDEDELKEIRQKAGKATFLKPADRAKLKQLLTRAFNIMRATVRLEDSLWNEVAPFTFAAYQKKLFSHNLVELRAAREIYSVWYEKRATALKVDIPAARRFVLASVAKEHETIFQQYPRLLSAIENIVSELAELELKYGTAVHPLRDEFSELNRHLRKLLHEDVMFLTKDIARIYDMRLATYNWIVEADHEVKPHIVPTAAKEKEQLVSARNFYLATYAQHLQNINQIYLGRTKA